MKCLAIDCNHNSTSHKCKFHRFPRNCKSLRAMWSKIARRRPTNHTHRLCSCHFKDGNNKNEPMLTIAKESYFGEEVCSPEKHFIRKALCSPSRGNRSDHLKLSTTVNNGPDVPLTCAENDNFVEIANIEMDSFKLSDSLLNDSRSLSIDQRSLLTEEENNLSSLVAVPVTYTLIGNGILSPFGQISLSQSNGDHITDNSVAEKSTFSTNESVSEMRQLRIVMKKLYKEIEDIAMERKKQRKSFIAASLLWKKEKEALLREKNQLLAENLILKDELKKMAGGGKR